MIDSLPDRRLTETEFDRLKSQNPSFHSIIGSYCEDGDISGLMIDGKNGDRHLILWSPRDGEWVHYDTLSKDTEADEQGARVQEFISEHYPDDHVLNEGSNDVIQ